MLERYKRSTVYEFNEAAKGYWRNWEREAWLTREIVWELIRGNPYYKDGDKPKFKRDVLKLSIDEEKEKKNIKKTPRVTEQDIKVYEHLKYNM